MNNVVVDIGNTRTKFAVFDEADHIICRGYSESELYAAVPKYAPFQTLLVASGSLSDELRTFLAAYSEQTYEAHNGMSMPLKIAYETPQTLGFDRIASCCGAIYLDPTSDNILVIDTGTAITYNYVVKNTFIGGNISPGVGMRFRALHDYTAHLPELKYPRKVDQKIGKNTQEAMESGVMQGVVYEIEKYIENYRKSIDSEGSVWITGGYFEYLNGMKKLDIKYNSDLSLIGLNEILKKQQIQ